MIFIVIYCFHGMDDLRGQESEQNQFIANVESSLVELVRMQNQIVDIHPLLSDLHPVVIADSLRLFIFDYDSTGQKYKFIKSANSPFAMPEKIRASFPLTTYSGIPSCIVTSDIFESPAGYVTIFHEFIHCAQMNTSEMELKSDLGIAREAARNNNFSWELTHPFPYQDPKFTGLYSNFLAAIETGDEDKVRKYRRNLKSILSDYDYQYMVWQEWKEGFARYIENLINRRLAIPLNLSGRSRQSDRIIFYYGGESLIKYLIRSNLGLSHDLKALFTAMYDLGRADN